MTIGTPVPLMTSEISLGTQGIAAAVAACAGAPACPQAGGPTRPLARALAAGVPRGAMLHVSGCAKGCAHPGPAAVTLVAVPGGFALTRDGAARDAPERLLSDPETFPLFKDFHAPEL